MKIRTRFEKYVLDRLTFLVYLMDHNDNPLEVHYADNIQDRGRICEDLSNKHNTTNIKHYEDFSIDITNVNQR